MGDNNIIKMIKSIITKIKSIKNLDILIFTIIIYIEIMLIIAGACKIDRYNYQHGIQYEYETLGDVTEDLIRKYTSWGNDFYDSIDNWVEEHALYKNKKTGGN